MRTTLALDDNLVNKARELTGEWRKLLWFARLCGR